MDGKCVFESKIVFSKMQSGGRGVKKLLNLSVLNLKP